MKLTDKIMKKFRPENNNVECIYGPPEMLEARLRGEKYDPQMHRPEDEIPGTDCKNTEKDNDNLNGEDSQ